MDIASSKRSSYKQESVLRRFNQDFVLNTIYNILIHGISTIASGIYIFLLRASTRLIEGFDERAGRVASEDRGTRTCREKTAYVSVRDIIDVPSE